MLCIKSSSGIYVNRVGLIDALEDIGAALKQRKRWWQKQDRSIIVLIKMISAFGEPPNAEHGDGGTLEFDKIKGVFLPPIKWQYCDDVGVCLRIVDLMQFLLFLPFTEYPLKIVMLCLVRALSGDYLKSMDE